jgi:hypothetical protein
MEVTSKAILNGSFLPRPSDMIPQNDAPRQHPKNRKHVAYLTFFSDTSKVVDNEGRINATPCSQRLRSISSNSIRGRYYSGGFLTYQRPILYHTRKITPIGIYPFQYPTKPSPQLWSSLFHKSASRARLPECESKHTFKRSIQLRSSYTLNIALNILCGPCYRFLGYQFP